MINRKEAYDLVSLEERLSNDHKVAIETLSKIGQGLEKGELDVDLFSEFEINLKNHIYHEETVVFPKLMREYNLKLEISGLEMEHAAMWRLIDLIYAEINEKKFNKILKYFDEVDRILQNHNAREEELIYPKIKGDVQPEQIERPSNWRCIKLLK